MSNIISFEELERRKLLSVSLAKGTLTVNGTDASDHITIYRSAGNAQRLHVKVNNEIRAYDLASVSNIVVKARGGNDRVTIDQSNGAIALPTRLYGDFGNDTITAGSGSDRISGGRGNDQLLGLNGHDVIYGELGNDDCQ